MERVKDVMGEILKNQDLQASTVNPVRFSMLDKYCESDVHKGKAVQMMCVDGEELCPICTREAENNKLSNELNNKAHEMQKQRRLDALLQNSIFEDDKLKNCGFKNYHASEGTEAASNKQKMIQVSKAYQEGQTFNTWLYGDPGAGKTHLAIAAIRTINELSSGERTCLFVNTSKLMQDIRRTFSSNGFAGETESSYIERCASPDILVLDDLGAESGRIGKEGQASDFVHRVLYGISNERLDKCTIITTNLTFEELEAMYDKKLISRLKGKHIALDFSQTKDYRDQKMNVGDVTDG
ncbi:ATP-binding protein [Listeria aquatica]|uniref:ATP-binding protein n=1 Tax=Listeria aquatica TaxID=1494960 RepID=UPI003EFAFC65